MEEGIVRHFKRVDPVLARIFPHIKPFTLKRSENLFLALISSIIYQQLSTKAGDAILQRFIDRFGADVSPSRVLSHNKEVLRNIGVSWAKTNTIYNLSLIVREGKLDFELLCEASNEEVIQRLVSIHGIGRWTAEMFLMFGLGREDVFSCQDVGLQRAIQRLYNLSEKPTNADMERISSVWRPYRTYAAYILWRSLSLDEKLLR